jgi:group II intron reverse transcriptase/maturase
VETRTTGEPREGTYAHAHQRREGRGDGWAEGEYLFDQIVTPEKVQKLQRALYRKAKAQPQWRFWSLYGELLRRDLMEGAMAAVAHNDGGPGLDGQSVQAYLANDDTWAAFRDGLIEELRTRRYRPSPVKRVWIDKGNGQHRPLGVPTVKDRVVQAAALLVLLPIFEADFHQHSYAYRPKRNAPQAMDAIKSAVLRGQHELIDADLAGYFDSIPHPELMRLVARRVSDGSVLALVRAWLRAPVVEIDRGSGRKRITPNRRGTPQGGVISPLLANLYLDGLDKGVNDRCELRPTMIRYADDFVICCRPGQGPGLLKRLKTWLDARGLQLNETKTRLVDVRQESIKFLGFRLQERRGQTGRNYPHVEPHSDSCRKLREKLREKLSHWTLCEPEEETIKSVNRLVKGWVGYYHYSNSARVFNKVQRFVCDRVRRWLWRRHACVKGKYAQYDDTTLWERYGLYRLPLWTAWKRA